MKELERELDKKLEAGKLRLQRYEREVYNKGINNLIKQNKCINYEED